MNPTERMNAYRGWVSALVCAIYNGECWTKEQVISFLHLGDPSLDYATRGAPPDKMTPEDIEMAMDSIFRRAGI